MASQKAVFLAPTTGRQLQVTVEESGEDTTSQYRIFFTGDQLTEEEEKGLPKDQELDMQETRTYLPCTKAQYEELMKVKGPGLVLISPMAAGRRSRKRRATRRAKKHTRRSRS